MQPPAEVHCVRLNCHVSKLCIDKAVYAKNSENFVLHFLGSIFSGGSSPPPLSLGEKRRNDKRKKSRLGK